MLSKQALSSKIAIIALVVLMVFLGDLKYRQWRSQQQIEQEKQSLQEQTDALQKKNNELNQSLQYLSSPDFKERVARQDLGLKKNGEVVYSFGNTTPPDPIANQPIIQPDSNAKKWWNYFFGIN